MDSQDTSNDDDYDMFLEKGKTYRLMLWTQEVIEGVILDPDGEFNNFYIKTGRVTRCCYYWDVEYGEKL